MIDLQTVDSLASVSTAGVAIYAYVRYRLEKRRIRRSIEQYLKLKAKAVSLGSARRHTVLHLVVQLGVPADKVLEAALESTHIRRYAATDENTGFASQILLEYED